jgi:hypothetical protein
MRIVIIGRTASPDQAGHSLPLFMLRQVIIDQGEVFDQVGPGNGS